MGLDKAVNKLYNIRRMDEDKKKLVKIDPELHRQAKIRAAEERKTLTEVVEVALRLFLAKES